MLLFHIQEDEQNFHQDGQSNGRKAWPNACIRFLKRQTNHHHDSVETDFK